jgi:hypothetical protein
VTPSRVACFPQLAGLARPHASSPATRGTETLEQVDTSRWYEYGGIPLHPLPPLATDYVETRVWVASGFSGTPFLLVRLRGAQGQMRVSVMYREDQQRWLTLESNIASDAFTDLLELLTDRPVREGQDRRDMQVIVHDGPFLVVESLRNGEVSSWRLHYDDPMSQDGERLFDFIMGVRMQSACEEEATHERRLLPPLEEMRSPAR